MTNLPQTALGEITEHAAVLFEHYGPLATAYAMLYQHCLDNGLPPPLAEHFVICCMDAMQ